MVWLTVKTRFVLVIVDYCYFTEVNFAVESCSVVYIDSLILVQVVIINIM